MRRETLKASSEIFPVADPIIVHRQRKEDLEMMGFMEQQDDG